MRSIALRVRGARLGAAMILILLAAAPHYANAGPTVGFIEKWPATTSGWSGSSAITYSNPLFGGVRENFRMRKECWVCYPIHQLQECDLTEP